MQGVREMDRQRQVRDRYLARIRTAESTEELRRIAMELAEEPEIGLTMYSEMVDGMRIRKEELEKNDGTTGEHGDGV